MMLWEDSPALAKRRRERAAEERLDTWDCWWCLCAAIFVASIALVCVR